jgi:hypothetical protein
VARSTKESDLLIATLHERSSRNSASLYVINERGTNSIVSHSAAESDNGRHSEIRNALGEIIGECRRRNDNAVNLIL